MGSAHISVRVSSAPACAYNLPLMLLSHRFEYLRVATRVIRIERPLPAIFEGTDGTAEDNAPVGMAVSPPGRGMVLDPA